MDALNAELDRLGALANGSATNATRKSHVGSGERSDKRRTYRFQDDRVIDHITGKSASCSKVMEGGFNLLW